MFSVLQRGADLLERLVLNLLMVSRLESGRALWAESTLPLAEILRSASRRRWEATRYSTSGYVPTRFSLAGGRELIAHMMDHLLDNALKFGGPGRDGNVTLRPPKKG